MARGETVCNALIQAVVENPDDHEPRLVVADWLEENGEPDRAESARLYCRLVKCLDAPASEYLARQRHELWDMAWMDYLGLPLTRDEFLGVFRRRLAETIAWCNGLRSGFSRLRPSGSFDMADSEPPLCKYYVPRRQHLINDSLNWRAERLREDGAYPDRAADSPAGGRLLLYAPDASLSDGAAEAYSEDFFDADNAPPWDTWVLYFDEQPTIEEERCFTSYLVAWVPPHLVQAADMGIRVNPEACIQWAAETDSLLARILVGTHLLD